MRTRINERSSFERHCPRMQIRKTENLQATSLLGREDVLVSPFQRRWQVIEIGLHGCGVFVSKSAGVQLSSMPMRIGALDTSIERAPPLADAGSVPQPPSAYFSGTPVAIVSSAHDVRR